MLKIYVKTPEHVLRVKIKQAGCLVQNLTLCGLSHEDCMVDLEDMISEFSSPVVKGKATTVEVRSAVGKVNGKTLSLRFFGLNPKQVKELIEYTLKQRENGNPAINTP